MDLGQRYHVSKGGRELRQEDGVLGNLAAPGHREESASHHFLIMKIAIKGVPATNDGDPPDFPLRGSYQRKPEESASHNLGHSLLVREGVRSTLLSRVHMKNHEKSSKINFPENHQGTS